MGKPRNPEGYRRRAIELREQAKTMTDGAAKQRLLRAAREYNLLAASVARIAGKPLTRTPEE